MAASSSAVGQGITAQSAKIITPMDVSIKKQEEADFMPGLVLMICSAGRSISPVEWMAPETRPSASPHFTISTP